MDREEQFIKDFKKAEYKAKIKGYTIEPGEDSFLLLKGKKVIYDDIDINELTKYMLSTQ